MKYRFCFPFLMMLLMTTFLLGQGASDTIPDFEIKPQENTLGEKDLNIYNLKNINKLFYYRDKEALRKIYLLEKKKEYEKLYQMLKKYVSEFGIQNFYRDTYLIWKLAKLAEVYSDFEVSKSLYKLVLRHHHEAIDPKEIEVFYETFNDDEVDKFVSLDYYYELVEYRKSIDTLRPPRGVLLNMGRSINSKSADYAPTLDITDDVLLFTSQRNKIVTGLLDNRPNEDLFYSKRTATGWTDAIPLDAVNSAYNEGSASVSRDGKTIFFSRCYAPECIGNCDLFYVELREDSTWSTAKNLGVAVNSVAWDSHPSLSHNGDTLYFASDRIGGFGLSDIYYTARLEDGSWSRAYNLGPVINTRNNEVSPFYHPYHEVLYFSSNGQLYSFGGYDIFKVKKEHNDWKEPKNIGPLVNGKGSEFYFTIDSKSRDLYYARSANEDLDKFDLYSFPLPMGAKPDSYTAVSGSLTDSLTGKPFTGIVSIIDIDNGTEVAPQYLREDGTFSIDLMKDRNYLLIVQGDEFFRIEEMFFLDTEKNFDLLTLPISSKVKFESIVFDPGKSDLKTEMFGDLNRIVNFLYDNYDFKLKISGHTDSRGSKETNLRLSKERAGTIRDYIVEFAGTEEHRVSYEGYGDTQPLVKETTEADRALNRRVEFEIYREKEEVDQGLPPNEEE